MEKEKSKMENKEAELMEAANMIQEKSREIEDTYNVSCCMVNTYQVQS